MERVRACIGRRWSDAGVWEAVSVTLAEIMADSGHYSIDSTTVRAHVSAAGGKGGTRRRALGRSRGGFTSKQTVPLGILKQRFQDKLI